MLTISACCRKCNNVNMLTMSKVQHANMGSMFAYCTLLLIYKQRNALSSSYHVKSATCKYDPHFCMLQKVQHCKYAHHVKSATCKYDTHFCMLHKVQHCKYALHVKSATCYDVVDGCTFLNKVFVFRHFILG